jgi:hypothetical protein
MLPGATEARQRLPPIEGHRSDSDGSAAAGLPGRRRRWDLGVLRFSERRKLEAKGGVEAQVGQCGA